jgi:solute carrier family 9B (sodium/hydrogen exchanger), member 1/2
MAKATVQAALGPVALKHITNPDDAKYGEIVLMLCVLSIILTAPTGAILITLTGTKLLTKTKAPPVTEGKGLTSRNVSRVKT